MDVRQGLESVARGQLAPAYLLVGDSVFWAREWIGAVRHKMFGENWADAYQSFDGAVDWRAVSLWLATVGFFGSGRMAVVKDGAWPRKAETLAQYLTRPVADSLLVVWEKKENAALEKLFGPERTVSVRPLNETEFARFVAAEVKRRRLTVSRTAQEVFCRAVRGDEFQVRHELDKMALYAPQRHWEERDIIETVVEGAADTAVWRLAEAVTAKNPTDGVRYLEALLREGKPPILLLVVVVRQLAQVLAAVEVRARGGTLDDFRQRLGLKPFVAKKVWGYSRRWSMAELHDALTRAMRLDRAMKTGWGDAVSWLTVYVASAAGFAKDLPR